MIAPGAKRIICIDCTNRCDLLRCSNCTRGLIYQQERVDMTPINFRRAVESLRDWVEQPPDPKLRLPGAPHNVIAMIGGNPCVSPNFEEWCAIFREVIPNRRARGLWTNNINGHGPLIRETFGYFNLNVHGVESAAMEMKRELPRVNVYGWEPHKRQSIHGGIFTAIRDFVGSAEIPDEAAMWAAIEKCDINVKWSGSIVQIKGEIYAYFCEMAATFESIYGHKTGLPVEPGWWRWGMDRFDAQSKEWCPKCGVPLRIRGHQDNEHADDFSKTHAPLLQIGIQRKQKTVMHDDLPTARAKELTDYERLRGD